MMEERAVAMTCQKCGIQYSRRRWAQHVPKCQGGVEGFEPVHHGRRWEYACKTCKVTVRKQRVVAHKIMCETRQRSFLEGGKKISIDGISTEISSKNGKNDEVKEIDLFRVANLQIEKSYKLSRPGSEIRPIDIIDEQDLNIIQSEELPEQPQSLKKPQAQHAQMINENDVFHSDQPQHEGQEKNLIQGHDKLTHSHDKLTHSRDARGREIPQIIDLEDQGNAIIGQNQMMVPIVHFEAQEIGNDDNDVYFEDQDQDLMALPPRAPTKDQIQGEKIRSSIDQCIKTKKIYKGKRLAPFRTSASAIDAGPEKILEIYTLTSLLRLVGRFTHQKKWQQRRGLIAINEFWDFMQKYNPMITHKPGARQYCQDVILKPFHYSKDHYCISNFEQLFLRVKELIMQYQVHAEKLEMIFRVPLWQRQQKSKRLLRKSPQTAAIRKKIAQYKYRAKKRNQMTKPKRGCYQKIRAKYDYLLQSVYLKDDHFETTNRLKRKNQSTKNPARQKRLRQKAFINYVCMSLADNITASVILGQFTIWMRKIEQIPLQERYKYQTPKLLSYKHWMPVPIKILNQKRWLFKNYAQNCARQCKMECNLSEEQIYNNVLIFYRRHGLLVDHALVEVEDGFNEIRALVDAKYRVEWQERRIRQKAALFEINPRVIQSESQIDQDDNLDERNYMFNPKKWRMTQKKHNMTGFQTCALCEKKVKFPVTSCRQCLGLYHSQCRESLRQCLCHKVIPQQQADILFRKAIQQAQKKCQVVELGLVEPRPASVRQIAAQERDLDLNLCPLQKPSFWCHPSPISYVKSDIPFLGPLSMRILNLYAENKAVYPVYVHDSPLRGRGLYADRDISKGQLVTTYIGRLINRLKVVAQANECHYLFDFQKGKSPISSFVIIPDTHSHLGQFLNHSKNSNVKPDKYWTNNGPIILFRATRDIRQTQQIFFDYGDDYPIQDSVEVVKSKVNTAFKEVVQFYANHDELPPLTTSQVLNHIPHKSPFHVVTFSKQELGKHAKIGHHMLTARFGETTCVFDTGVSRKKLLNKMKYHQRIFIFSQKQRQSWECGYIAFELAERLSKIQGISVLEQAGVVNVAFQKQEDVVIDLE